MPHTAGEPLSFSYHRAVAPMMWVFVALASIELVVVHLLILLFWNGTAAILLSLATLAGIGWLIVATASMRRLPVLVDAHGLVMRVGTLKAVKVPLANIAGCDGGITERRTTLNMALIAHPNVVISLRTPLPGRRAIRAIAHRLDDPDAFGRTLRAECRATEEAR